MLNDPDASPVSNILGSNMLLRLVADGVAAVFGPLLMPLRAKGEGWAKRIATKDEIKRQRLLAEEVGDATHLGPVHGADSIAEEVRRAFQENPTRRTNNIARVVELAAEGLDDLEVPDVETDQDWTARFFNYVADISSSQMQELWAQVLRAEVIRKGSTSVHALSVLRNLDPGVAHHFSHFCRRCTFVENGLGGMFLSHGRAAQANGLLQYGFGYANLLRLQEYGLVAPDLASRWALWGVHRNTPADRISQTVFRLNQRDWVLGYVGQCDKPLKRINLAGVALSVAGLEISRCVRVDERGREGVRIYVNKLTSYLANDHAVRLVPLDAPERYQDEMPWMPRLLRGAEAIDR